jgi:hypothetical protein
VDALDFPHLGATRKDGRIGRVVARDEIGHDGLGPLHSLAEAIEFFFPLEVKEAGEHSAHLLLERNTEVLGVKGDLVLTGVVSHSLAIAWELSGTKGVAMEVNPKVGVADA